MTFKIRTLLARLIAGCLVVLSFGTATHAGEFESLLQGRIIDTTDGFIKARLTLAPMSKATATISADYSIEGFWWARPDGRVCVNFKSLWEGGDCGFIRKEVDGYSLTLGTWKMPEFREETREFKRMDHKAPASPPDSFALTRKSLIGKLLRVEGQYGDLAMVFNDDATFKYASDDGMSFSGHWWVREDGSVCFVSRTLWRLGNCFEAHGTAGQLEYFVTANEWRNWFRADLRSGISDPAALFSR